MILLHVWCERICLLQFVGATPWIVVVPHPLHVNLEEDSVVFMTSVLGTWSVEKTTVRISTLRQSLVTHAARVSQVICHTSLTKCYQIIPYYYFLTTHQIIIMSFDSSFNR